MANGGRLNNSGAIFKLTQAGVYSVLKSFSINTDGGRPLSSLVQTADSTIYGLTNAGCAFGYGTLFKLTSTGTYSEMKSFNIELMVQTHMAAC